MTPVEPLDDYLIDQEDDIKKALTYFLNLVMRLESPTCLSMSYGLPIKWLPVPSIAI